MKNVQIFIWCLFCLCIPYTVSATTVQIKDEDEKIKQIELSDYLLLHQMDMFIDWKRINHLTEQISESITKPPENAILDKEGNIESGKTGLTLDKRAFEELIGDAVVNQVQQDLDIPKKKLYPQVDTELLQQIKKNRLGTYTTFFKQTNKERINNIQLATEAINNHVIFPGDAFSFNDTVGKRTQERGYLRAPVIVKGELSEGIGGGICQVSSTLYNAVDSIGMDIKKRYSHSRSVPYVPPGRDATVSWYGPDFVFENPYSQPILIRAFSEKGKMIVTLYSSDAVRIKRRDVPELKSS